MSAHDYNCGRSKKILRALTTDYSVGNIAQTTEIFNDKHIPYSFIAKFASTHTM